MKRTPSSQDSTTFQRNSIAFPIIETFLNLLLDKQWHNKAFVKRDWRQSIPPEYFARRAVSKPAWNNSKGKVTSFIRTINGVADRLFHRTVLNSIESEYIEIRELSSKRFENYEIRITDKGVIRATDKAPSLRLITINGETHGIHVWCKKLDLSYNRFRHWLFTKKVSPEEAIEKSRKGAPNARARYLTYNGETKTLTEWCKILGVNRNRFNHYLKTMTVEGAIERSKNQTQE